MRATFAAWPMTPMVKRLLIINGIIWLVTVVVGRLGFAFPMDIFAVSGDGVLVRKMLWQPFTYMWFHATDTFFGHIFTNSLFLWMFGGTLEKAWGWWAFLKFYLLCGVGAGLLVLLSSALFYPQVETLGASGAIYGLVVAWVITNPNKLIYLFGVFPMKGKHFALIPIGFALIDFIMAGSGTSHSAHLGGMAVGALLVTGYWRPTRLKNRIRLWYLRRRLTVIEGGGKNSPKPPPDGGYWH